ncbi:gastric triacylglycerol lipase-like isoform X2 [Homarus americanus]|uniref:gastric triacylglycerol lipase-like isoform X2 n=1 Tax=Homarus americanus TaxID=6706 RepID=UPI001C4510B6|nr:gastric triacylglycerol lipase-like isoform X2 [Homarus americanus]
MGFNVIGSWPVGHPHGALGKKAGYHVEDHTVVTEDGYILTIHHLSPYANPARCSITIRKNKRDPYINVTFSASVNQQGNAFGPEVPGKVENKWRSEDNGEIHTQDTSLIRNKVVFLQHGLMGSSDNWNTNTEEDSLAYLLSDAGYDVWMGNFRGNIYSRKHMNFTHNDPHFWRFSYDEMAHYDLPAMLDYVILQTGVEKLHYLGHSMGTTVFFALMSSQPEYQQKIASMIALAPVATVTSISSPIKYLAPLVNELQFVLRLFGNDQDLMTNRLLISLWDPYRVCRSHTFCENLQFIITGFDPSRADQGMVPIILSHNPAGASTQTLFHFAQGFNSGRFQNFDWGKKKNLLHYGQIEPPEYDVTKIKVPITMFWANNDWLAGEKDVHHLEKQLPHLQACYKVPNPMFSHLDFLWATDARSLVYEKVFEVLDIAVKKYQ